MLLKSKKCIRCYIWKIVRVCHKPFREEFFQNCKQKKSKIQRNICWIERSVLVAWCSLMISVKLRPEFKGRTTGYQNRCKTLTIAVFICHGLYSITCQFPEHKMPFITDFKQRIQSSEWCYCYRMEFWFWLLLIKCSLFWPHRLDGVAPKPEPINWDLYSKNISKPGMVEAFKKAVSYM